MWAACVPHPRLLDATQTKLSEARVQTEAAKQTIAVLKETAKLNSLNNAANAFEAAAVSADAEGSRVTAARLKEKLDAAHEELELARWG